MASLEELRRKVEAGERLSETELDALKHAALEQGGFTLRLAFAHALINSQAALQALPLLERLVRDHPKDVQAHLGHARALTSLERYPEAERPVQQALALSPQDPEALKALAVLCLRRGEVARARMLVTDVLRVDPFDGEAKVLQGELESADFSVSVREQPRKSTVPPKEFADALARLLSNKGVAVLRGEDHLLLRLGPGRVAKVDLNSLYAGYLADGRALGETVETFAQELLGESLDLPGDKEQLLASVLPVLRPPVFLEKARSAASREGPSGLLVYFVLDDPKLVRYLPAAALEARRVSVEEVDAAAWRNLSARCTEPKSVSVEGGEVRLSLEPQGLWALCEEDGHDGARLLLPTQREKLLTVIGPGPYRVSLGQREMALVCQEKNVVATARLDAATIAPDGIPGRFRLDANGSLVSMGDTDPL